MGVILKFIWDKTSRYRCCLGDKDTMIIRFPTKTCFFSSVACFMGLVLLIAPLSAKASTEPAETATPLYFAVQPLSDDQKMAYKAVEPLLQKAQTEVGRQIPVAVARTDLNDDGVKELFVRMLDPDYFCDNDMCQVYGFAVTDKGFIKIADFKTRTIDVLDTKTEATRDLKLGMSDTESRISRWNGGLYE